MAVTSNTEGGGATGSEGSRPTAGSTAASTNPYTRVVTGHGANGTSGASDGAHGGPVTAATTPELIGRLVNDLSDLVDRQIELAKQEIREDIKEALGAGKTLGIGAGIGAAGGLLLLITAWTAFIWLFNWIGEKLLGLVGWGAVGASLGWLVGFLVPAGILFFAWKKFIQPGIHEIKIKPLERTRATLKEDLEWVRRLRTPSAK